MPSPSLHVIQLTDTHLFARPQQQLLGVETEHTFQAAFTAIRESTPTPDLFLLTGDLSQDGSRESYARLRGYLHGCPIPAYWLPGNHDYLPAMEAELSETVPWQEGGRGSAVGDCLRSDKAFSRQNWRFILLNSQIPNAEGGYLNHAALSFLEAELAWTEQHQQHALICLHHPPLLTGSAWLDTSTLQEPGRLFRVLDRFSCVRAVLFGHIHQEFCYRRKQVQYLGCPSTCIQFKPSSQRFALDLESPAFRQLSLYENGNLKTQVVRVPAAMVQPNLSAAGY